MQPFPKSGAGSIGKIGDVVLDPSKTKIDPNIFKGLFPPTCNSGFSDHFKTIKQQIVSANLAILPNNNDTLNFPAMGETVVTFKAKDNALATELSSWHPDLKVPNFTIAYAKLPKVTYIFGGIYTGILCISTAAEGTHHLFLQSINGGHPWTSDLTITYCKKDKLYLLNSFGYTMSIDFGL